MMDRQITKQTNGQVILGLILVMVVALGIGLSIVQKSLVDVSTSSKVEQSSRAFSAAEAGIEKALQGDTNLQGFGNTASIKEISDTKLAPCIPGASGCAQLSNTQQLALEYPPLSKEDIAHVWLADLTSTANPPQEFYKQGKIEMYWGSSEKDQAAIEVKIIYYDSSTTPPAYKTIQKFFDSDSQRASKNGFAASSCTNNNPIETILGNGRNFYCKEVVASLPPNLMLIRARLLYNSSSQPLAVRGSGSCGAVCSLPPQARVLKSIGISGETQRQVQVFQMNKVVPAYFDYAIFSAGEIKK